MFARRACCSDSDAEASMTRRIAALSCCLLLLHSSVAAAADEGSTTYPSPLTLSAVNAAPPTGPIRAASMNKESLKVLDAGARTNQSGQNPDVDDRSWVERHPVWTGAILGFSTVFALTYMTTRDDDDEFIKVMSAGAGALFWGGVGAGVGALAGWGIGRSRDDN
jgi:hypothetical protein